MYYESANRVKKHQAFVDLVNEDEDDDPEAPSDDASEGVEDDADHLPYSSLPASLRDDDIQIIGSIAKQQSSCSLEIRQITQIKSSRYNCARDKCVELQDGAFIRIKSLAETRDGAQWIIGNLFARQRGYSDSKWPRHHNELVMSVKVENGNVVDLVRRPVNQVKRNRHLILTNQTFPEMSSQTHPDACEDKLTDIEFGPIFCRWKQTHYLDDKGRIIQESIERLTFELADKQTRSKDWLIRLQWRKVPTIPGGDHVVERLVLSDDPEVEPKKEHYRRYVMGDAFCGAGGASTGARLAGMSVGFGVDRNKEAMQTYELNFKAKGTLCLLTDVHDFILDLSQHQSTVDILHISPPCQAFSPAHTVPNWVIDEMNEAALFSVGALITGLKPRAVTLEETYGLFNRHKLWFNALIKMFIDCGYSVRWTGAQLEKLGLPQCRKRLLIIAAGPGEILAPFPKYTHSATDHNLTRLTTIHDAINSIPASPSTITHHDIKAATYTPEKRKLPYSAHTQAKTITCTGGIGNHHPSGNRNFTIRELASLQRFPMEFKFPEHLGVTALRRQIGNAVPPFVFKKIFRSVVDSLKKTDGIL